MLDAAICSLARDLLVDVVLLVEYPTTPTNLLLSMRKDVDPSFWVPHHIKDKFVCLSRDQSLSLNELCSEPRFSLKRFFHDSHSAILAVVHGIDPVNNNLSHRCANAQKIMAKIQGLMGCYQCERIIIVGDFNINPYDMCMNLPMVFNSMMTRACIRKQKRTFQFEQYDFFYNPMWGLFGDIGNGPSGTFYYTGSNGIYGWNMLDQAILHYTLADYLDSVCIVKQTASVNLADARGRPNRAALSDHYPIMITLKRSLT